MGADSQLAKSVVHVHLDDGERKTAVLSVDVVNAEVEVPLGLQAPVSSRCAGWEAGRERLLPVTFIRLEVKRLLQLNARGSVRATADGAVLEADGCVVVVAGVTAPGARLISRSAR